MKSKRELGCILLWPTITMFCWMIRDRDPLDVFEFNSVQDIVIPWRYRTYFLWFEKDL